ncbi:carbonic anhydrase [Desulfurivibrio sp. D14AmB]|uniref:carbonic anhydrase n=1 Tax=Desulfurivibrio sp. D14AmB TaxID=3374370 RepID=UPI00376EF316
MAGNRIIIMLIIGLIWPAATGLAMEPVPKIRAGIPPYSVLGRIMAANQQVMAGVAENAPGQKISESPQLVWLADPDPRLNSIQVWADQAGGVYTVRNLANQLEPAAGAIDYAVRHLYAPVLLITGNTDSTAIQLFAEGYDHLGEAIRRELSRLHPALSRLPRSGREANGEEELAAARLRAVEANVDYQVARALERYGDRVQSGRLVVVGAVIDLANQYQAGPGRLHLINLNGETEAEKIKASPHLIRLNREMRDYVGRKF